MRRWLRYAFIVAAAACCAGCAAFKPQVHASYDYIAVETPNDECVVLNGDTLRYGTTPEVFIDRLHLRNDTSNLKLFSEIVYDLNRPKTVYGFVEKTGDNVTVEIYSPDSLFVFDFGPLMKLRPGRYPRIKDLPDLCRGEEGYRIIRKRNYYTAPHRRIHRESRFERSFRKNTFNVSLSLPWTHFYSFYPTVARSWRSGDGFIGLGVGVEYLYHEKMGVAAEWNGMLCAFIPVVAPLDIEWNGPHESVRLMSLNVSNYHHLRRFTLGYGINVTNYSWDYYYEAREEELSAAFPLGTEDRHDRSWSAGLSLAGYVNILPHMVFGVSYRPTFYTFGKPEPWRYGHVISLDLKFYLLR